MANVVVFNPDDANVPGRVVSYLLSVHTPYYYDQPNVIINPQVLSDVDTRYWKVVEGTITEMNVAEKSIVDAEQRAIMEEAQKD